MFFLEKLAKNVLRILLIFILPLMILTNPNKVEYVVFAGAKFKLYAQEAICNEALFSQECNTMLRNKLETEPNYIEQFFLEKSTRKNFYIFSIYLTKFDIDLKIEKYKSVKRADFLCIGILQNFVIFQKPDWEDFPRN